MPVKLSAKLLSKNSQPEASSLRAARVFLTEFHHCVQYLFQLISIDMACEDCER